MVWDFSDLVHIEGEHLFLGLMSLQLDFEVQQLVWLFLIIVEILLPKFHLLLSNLVLDDLRLKVQFFNEIMVLLLLYLGQVEFFEVWQLINIDNIIPSDHRTQSNFKLFAFFLFFDRSFLCQKRLPRRGLLRRWRERLRFGLVLLAAVQDIVRWVWRNGILLRG